MVKKNLLLIQEDGKRQYLRMFLLGFFTLLVVLLPIVIFNKGYFIYYGDFNSQQIPFYHLAHDAVRSGQLGWNWQTDLGANFIGSYSFYLLGSPFFWLTIPFPSGAVPYLIPWLLCLKHGMATMTGYAYIRRFVRSPRAAAIGAMLYAFSGFQAYNIFFNHFQDVTAFFPLLLIALEERVNNNRRGVFALAVALMAMLNYFFFAGQVVFVLVYFLFRCTCKDFHITRRKFFSIALESIIGVLLSAVLLLPSCLTILENNRVTERHEYGGILRPYPDHPDHPELLYDPGCTGTPQSVQHGQRQVGVHWRLSAPVRHDRRHRLSGYPEKALGYPAHPVLHVLRLHPHFQFRLLCL